MQKLVRHNWPGNVRELERSIQRAVILASRPLLDAADIELPEPAGVAKLAVSNFRRAKTEAIDHFERVYLTNLLAVHQGNVTRAAKAAGKERRSFQRLLSKYCLSVSSFV
jgi:two-component system response regulator GlrR